MKNTKKLQNWQEFKDSVRILAEAKEEKDRIIQHYETVRRKESLKISNWFFCNLPQDQKSIEVELDEGANYYANHTKYMVTKKQTKTIIWNIAKIKQIFAKQIQKKILNKIYTVNDWDGLVKLMKKHRVPPNEFKQFFDLQEKVNEKEIDRLAGIGKISIDNLNECYSVKIGEPTIVLTKK